jgi:hypothetical protein
LVLDELDRRQRDVLEAQIVTIILSKADIGGSEITGKIRVGENLKG